LLVTMKIVVQRVHSPDVYLRYWTRAMADVHWFKKRRLFDYAREEMFEQIAEEFEKPESVHFVAKSRDAGKILGVLGVKTKGSVGYFGRWEPAVPLEYRDSGAGEALIREASSWLRKNRVGRIACMVRYPYSKPETGQWHMALYRKCGFTHKGPVGLMLLANLQRMMKAKQKVENLHIVDGNDFPLKEFVDFTTRAYMSMPEDKAIHGHDPYVSSPDENVRLLRAVKDGKYGFSPPECWKVAELEDEVAGFVIAFMPKTKYRPSHGVIAELGVFPEFRRKGIAYSLVAEMHECFKNHGGRYSYVGTPRTNETAIRMYRKAGYKPVFVLVDFEKPL